MQCLVQLIFCLSYILRHGAWHHSTVAVAVVAGAVAVAVAVSVAVLIVAVAVL